MDLLIQSEAYYVKYNTMASSRIRRFLHHD
jgi:hypothetical protein